MNSLSWSSGARNVLSDFYESDYVIYVEGTSDIRFWDILISKFTTKKIKIKIPEDNTSGKDALYKILRKRKLGSTYYVAMDADYDKYFNEDLPDGALLTYGYSFENSLLTEKILCKLIANLSHKQLGEINEKEIGNWINNLEANVSILLKADIFNKTEKITEVAVMPSNASRFYKIKDKVVCPDEIEGYLNELGFCKGNLSSFCLNSEFKVLDLIKGHFLLSAVLVFVKSVVDGLRDKAVTISQDAFYSSLLLSFESNLNKEHPHYHYYQENIKSILG